MASDFKSGRPEAHPLTEGGPKPERQAFGDHPEQLPCCRCGRPVEGRRRNGYCSDRCRMRDRRDGARRGLETLFEQAERALAELRRRVLP
jgi:hypothetical protein